MPGPLLEIIVLTPTAPDSTARVTLPPSGVYSIGLLIRLSKTRSSKLISLATRGALAENSWPDRAIIFFYFKLVFLSNVMGQLLDREGFSGD